MMDGSCLPLNRVQRILICDGWILFSVKKGSASPNLLTDESGFPLNRVHQVLICDGWLLFSVE